MDDSSEVWLDDLIQMFEEEVGPPKPVIYTSPKEIESILKELKKQIDNVNKVSVGSFDLSGSIHDARLDLNSALWHLEYVVNKLKV